MLVGSTMASRSEVVRKAGIERTRTYCRSRRRAPKLMTSMADAAKMPDPAPEAML